MASIRANSLGLGIFVVCFVPKFLNAKDDFVKELIAGFTLFGLQTREEGEELRIRIHQDLVELIIGRCSLLFR